VIVISTYNQFSKICIGNLNEEKKHEPVVPNVKSKLLQKSVSLGMCKHWTKYVLGYIWLTVTVNDCKSIRLLQFMTAHPHTIYYKDTYIHTYVNT